MWRPAQAYLSHGDGLKDRHLCGGLSSGAIAICLVAIIAGLAVYFYIGNNAPSDLYWVRNGIDAECAVSMEYQYSIPRAFICPTGVFEKMDITRD